MIKYFRNKIIKIVTEVVLIQLFFYSVVSKQKIKKKTRNTMASSYHAKVTSTQNKGVPLFFCLGHGVYYYIFLFGKSQSFSDSSYLIMLIDVQRLHENGK